MPTSFEFFVNTELPQRAVMLTAYNTGGYTGDPRSATLDKIKYAPKGTWFIDEATGDLWQKLIQINPAAWVQRSTLSALTEATHHVLDDQVHNLAETYVKEITRTIEGVTEVLCRTTGSIPIRRTLLTRATGVLTQVERIQYNAAGAEVHRMTGVITRAAGKISSIAWTYSG